MKTLLLENDGYFRAGQKEFCESFDKNFVIINTEVKHGNYDVTHDYMFVATLSQPFVERCITTSSFESPMNPRVANRGDFDKYWQVEHFLKLIESAIFIRKRFKYNPLVFEINYLGINFIEDILEEKWGWDFSANFKRIIRQNPDTFIVNLYDEYKLVKRLVESDFYPEEKKIKKKKQKG